MSAYLIVNVEVKDPAAYQQYLAGAPALIRKHGGEYLVRGGSLEVIEGNWKPTRLVVLRFPDGDSARAFMNDPDYQPLKEIRHRAAKTDMVLTDGM
jgi:uncharacterized protein (DUF1330 family)